MIYNYGGKTQTAIQFDSIIINNNEYQVPAIVADTLEKYEANITKVTADYTNYRKAIEENKAKKYDKIADDLISALGESANRDSLLAKDPNNHYGKVDPVTCEPIYEFRRELRSRIIPILMQID